MGGIFAVGLATCESRTFLYLNIPADSERCDESPYWSACECVAFFVGQPVILMVFL
jgi:hypothetical protein